MAGSILVIVGLSGCASSANREAMVASDVQIAQQHDRTIAVRTGGGAETTAMDSSNIADGDLKAAIEESIIKTKVFKSVVQGKDADYDLAVSIVKLDKPVFGLTFTVNMEATWVLIKQSDKSVVMKRSIESSSTATFSDAAAAVTRLRLAVEGAAKRNIEQGMQALSALSL
ncbi:MAG: hypothetical protein KGP14_01095 [Betaproteobacteria bacterium]|nr:hypothetical protein [Betaproteobacteria bacterium]